MPFADVHSLELNEDDNIMVKGQRYDFGRAAVTGLHQQNSVITPSVDLRECLVHVDGETHIDSDVTDY